MIKEMKKLNKNGFLDSNLFVPTPEEYLSRMGRPGCFVDHLFLSVCAGYLGHDLVILHLNAETAANGVYTMVYGGPYLSGTSGLNCPLFLGNFQNYCIILHLIRYQNLSSYMTYFLLIFSFIVGYYEDSHYQSPHYQSVTPYRDSTTLRSILDNGGFDVVSFLELPGQLHTVLFNL